MNAPLLDWPVLAARANADGEFRLHARFWNARLRLGCGPATMGIEIRHGAIHDIQPWDPAWFGADLNIRADAHEWDALLAPLPKPFYHDLWAANAHHGFSLGGDTHHLCAYYPAVRRLVELMREVRNADPAHRRGEA